MFGRKRGNKGEGAKPKAKPKKEKKPKAEKTSRPKPARPAGPVRKQPTNIYTVMLLLAMIALLLANIFIWVELFHYGSWPQWTT